jgi:hypothetical protein
MDGYDEGFLNRGETYIIGLGDFEFPLPSPVYLKMSLIEVPVGLAAQGIKLSSILLIFRLFRSLMSRKIQDLARRGLEVVGSFSFERVGILR